MMLVAAAADNWGVDASKCSAQNGMVKGPGRKKAAYGKLAEKASSMEVPKEVALNMLLSGNTLVTQNLSV